MSDRILRLQEVMERTGLCRSHVYGLEGFPKPFKLGSTRSVGWSEADVEEWIKETIHAAKLVNGKILPATARKME